VRVGAGAEDAGDEERVDECAHARSYDVSREINSEAGALCAHTVEIRVGQDARAISDVWSITC